MNELKINLVHSCYYEWQMTKNYICIVISFYLFLALITLVGNSCSRVAMLSPGCIIVADDHRFCFPGENNRTVCLALAVPTVHRLVTTCDASLHWCSTRGLLYLESWTLGAFLLVTQSDFKVRQDVIRRVGVGS